MRHLCYINKQVTGRETDSSITRLKGAKFFASFLKDEEDCYDQKIQIRSSFGYGGSNRED